MKEEISRRLLQAVTLAGVGLGAYLLWRTLSRFDLDEALRALPAFPGRNIGLCILFAAASYLCLTVEDWLGLRYVGRPLPYRKAALTSFVSLSLGHNIGLGGLSSGAIRYRFYSRWGLSVADIARLMLFCGATVVLGLSSVSALVLSLQASSAASQLHLSVATTQMLGAALGAVAAIYIGLSFWGARIRFRSWQVDIPKPVYAIAQIAVGTVNYACVAACLYAAVSAVSPATYPQVVSAFVVGNTASVLMHVPGGLGVIETAVLYFLPHGTAGLLASLILFRAVYYLLPLGFGLIAFALTEIMFWRSRG